MAYVLVRIPEQDSEQVTVLHGNIEYKSAYKEALKWANLTQDIIILAKIEGKVCPEDILQSADGV